MYVIYSNKTFRKFITNNNGAGYYETEQAAKRIRTRFKLDEKEWIVDTSGNYYKAEPMVKVKSLMTGEEVEIPASSRGSRASDPSMEGYWTL